MRCALVLLLLVGCSEPARPGSTPSKYEVRAVCAAEIAKLNIPPLLQPAADAETAELVAGLVPTIASSTGKARELAVRDITSLGIKVLPALTAFAGDSAREEGQRLVALDLIGAIDAPECAEALVQRVDIRTTREAWVRAQSCYQLTRQSSDHWLPVGIQQLKYESDSETVMWLAAALAKHANFAGFDGLRVLAVEGKNDTVKAEAFGMLSRLAQEAGFTDANTLYLAWYGQDPEQKLPRREPSPRLRANVWQRISQMSDFNLRLVDDARFALSRSAAWVVEPLIAALREENAFVRIHVAQTLERIGPRASQACSALEQALDEPRMAPASAAALGAIGCTRSRAPLEARTRAEVDPELRSAAVAGLGRLGAKESVVLLESLLAAREPLDLRQSAAQALLAIGEHAAATQLLAECLTAPGADTGAAEAALEAALRRAAATDDAARARLDAWQAAGKEIVGTPTVEQAAALRKARRALFTPAPR